MVSEFSNQTMNGVPADWDTTLFDTGKSTLLKVTTPAIIPPEGTTASKPVHDNLLIRDHIALLPSIPGILLRRARCSGRCRRWAGMPAAGACRREFPVLYLYNVRVCGLRDIRGYLRDDNLCSYREEHLDIFSNRIPTNITRTSAPVLNGENHGWAVLRRQTVQRNRHL